jgi:hypothetical protein
VRVGMVLLCCTSLSSIWSSRLYGITDYWLLNIVDILTVVHVKSMQLSVDGCCVFLLV